ncbi:hypothetical protein DB35_28380 [Streptomyces abyssalis]|uniref:Uncharacterized protein n=2 Tax=Streptomyces abyssalis TaxID=933944 RepID=A0A1E7JJQ3_9ACTN|nr:hypothetical protein DB35_28380 [Streptomyces abyssalis]OEU87874.1 hypothetical protein AN215_16460 [Streptomyces abyssalis]
MGSAESDRCVSCGRELYRLANTPRRPTPWPTWMLPGGEQVRRTVIPSAVILFAAAAVSVGLMDGGEGQNREGTPAPQEGASLPENRIIPAPSTSATPSPTPTSAPPSRTPPPARTQPPPTSSAPAASSSPLPLSEALEPEIRRMVEERRRAFGERYGVHGTDGTDGTGGWQNGWPR